MRNSQSKSDTRYLWDPFPRRRDVPVDYQSIHTYDWWESEEAAANEPIVSYRDVTPEELTPEMALNLFRLAFAGLGRQAQLLKTLALENAPRKRGRPRKGKDQVVSIRGESPQTVQFPNRPLTPEEARALGSVLLQAARAAEIPSPDGADDSDELIGYDEILEPVPVEAVDGAE